MARATQIPDDVLSEVIYCFFPASEKIFYFDVEMRNPYEKYILEVPYGIGGGESYIYAGSRTEGLMLPFLKRVDLGTISIADQDKMLHLKGIDDLLCRNMSLEIDKDHPVFCRIKHGISLGVRLKCKSHRIQGLYDLIKNSYLNSSAGKKFLENYLKVRDNLHTYNEQSKSSPALMSVSECYKGTYTENNDTVFCVKVKLKSEMIRTFLNRLQENRWPLNLFSNLDKLLTEHVYAIPKPYPCSETGDLRWRLSFSVIEVELARSLTDIQRRCYRVLKALIKFNVNEGLQEKEKFPSYYLKTLMFWLCEKTSKDSWTIKNLGRQWLTLLDNIIKSLESRKLEHYFITSYNLLYDKTPRVIKGWLERFKQIRQKPLDAFTKFWLNHNTLNAYFTDWGDRFRTFVSDISSVCSQKENPMSNEITNVIKDKTEGPILCLLFYAAEYLLGCYGFTELVTFADLHPQIKECIDISPAHVKELVPWVYLITTWKIPNLKPVNACSQWSSLLAEVTHHLTIKYGNQVPCLKNNQNFFNKETAERFHLLACSIGKKENINFESYVKYANFLLKEKCYEDGIQILLLLCNQSYELSSIGSMTSEVLDVCLKLSVACFHKIILKGTFLIYHLMMSCYLEAHVLTEVRIPEYLESGGPPPDLHPPYWSKLDQNQVSQIMPLKKILYGFQFILGKNLLEAFKVFVSLSDRDVVIKTLQYNVMLYILSRSYKLYLDEFDT